jgi:hypothetical protein
VKRIGAWLICCTVSDSFVGEKGKRVMTTEGDCCGLGERVDVGCGKGWGWMLWGVVRGGGGCCGVWYWWGCGYGVVYIVINFSLQLAGGLLLGIT